MKYYEAVTILHHQIDVWKADIRAAKLYGDHCAVRKYEFLVDQLIVAAKFLEQSGAPDDQLFGLAAYKAPESVAAQGGGNDTTSPVDPSLQRLPCDCSPYAAPDASQPSTGQPETEKTAL